MDSWKENDLDKLEAVMNTSIENINQIKFIATMKHFASVGVCPSKKQLKYLHWLWLGKNLKTI